MSDIITPDFTFVVPGAPKPWERLRRDGRNKRTFTSSAVANRKADVIIIGGAKMRSRGIKMAPKGVPVLLWVDGFFKIGPSISKKERARRMAQLYHTHDPDADNITKLIKDALNGVCWADDNQVTIMRSAKWWTEGASKTVIGIKTIGETK